MDPLSAVGLAGNIIQFIGCCVGLFSATRRIYSSSKGTTEEFEQLQETCHNLTELTTALIPAKSPDTLEALPDDVRPMKAEIDLARLSSKCKDLAEELSNELSALRLDDASRTKFGSFRLAIKSKLSNHRIDELHKRVNQYRDELMMYIIAVTNMKQSSLLRHLQELKRANLDMVNDHSSIVNKMTDLVNKLPIQAEMVLERDEDIPELLDIISRGLQSILATSTRKFIPEHHIVRSLYFESLPARYESIRDAHKMTFEWVLQPHPPDETPSSSKVTIRDWLQSGSGIYWVSGKPGSGKSTFMKFVADHSNTPELLDEWASSDEPAEHAQPSECILASFYFWNAGTRLQKSTDGLLRSLLFEVLSHAPELIPIVFPKQWSSLTVRGQHLGMQCNKLRDWTTKELSAALRHLSTAPACSSKRFCFFIDGLDEYHGDHRELMSMLLAMSANRNIKLCVSSRPWNVFEDVMGRDASRKFYIHEHTRDDITRYTASTLQSDENWVSEVIEEPRYNDLVNKITDKAHGVFLWVVLVVRSLQEGLSNGDSLRMLDQRIQKMPEELGPFFRHILLSVPSEYHSQMALYFQFALSATSDIDLMHLSFIDDCFENEQFAFDTPIVLVYACDIFIRQDRARRRLSARCKGLLEAQPLPISPHLYTRRITFLHRTVRDFLLTDEMSCFLEKLREGTQINTVFLGSLVAYTKMMSNDTYTMLLQALHYARGAEKESADTAICLVNELPRIMQARELNSMVDPEEFHRLVVSYGLCGYVSNMIHASMGGFYEVPYFKTVALQYAELPFSQSANTRDMLSMLLELEAGIDDEQWAIYVKQLSKVAHQNTDVDLAKIDKRILSLILPHVKNMKGWGVVLVDFASNHEVSRRVANIRAQMIEELFANGADPNDPTPSGTCWISICDCLRKTRAEEKSQRNPVRLEFLANITEMLLKAGADISHSGSLTDDEVHAIFPASLAKPISDLLRERHAYARRNAGWRMLLSPIDVSRSFINSVYEAPTQLKRYSRVISESLPT